MNEMCDMDAIVFLQSSSHVSFYDSCFVALATMGAGVPNANACKLLYPDRKIVSISGDGGFMMNEQELGHLCSVRSQCCTRYSQRQCLWYD